MTDVWRVVGVLEGATPAVADEIGRVVRASMVDLGVRVYASGRHVVVVTSIPSASGADAQDVFDLRFARLAPRLPSSTVVADVWHGRRPARDAAAPRAADAA